MRRDVAFLKVTYLDNEALDEATVNAIEMRRGDGTNNWWRVYGLGEIGSLEGNVYQGWQPMDKAEIQKQGKLVRYGLDFGFSPDPAAMVSVWLMKDGSVGFIEEVYKTGLLPSNYAPLFQEIGIDPSVLIVADGARQEIIAEIKEKGYRCISALKDAGSVKRGIDRVRERKIYYYGKNLEQEFLTYHLRVKKSTGETLDEPQDGNDHLMDALRYAIDDLEQPKFDL